MKLLKSLLLLGLACFAVLLALPAIAQTDTAFERLNAKADNRPLDSLSRAAEISRNKAVTPGPPREVPNYRGKGGPSIDINPNVPDPILQNVTGSAPVVAGIGFEGTDNETNGSLLGFLIAPPDTDGQIGGANGEYFVQMINLLTTIFDRDGSILTAPFASNAIWAGIGGNCETYNQGDPIVLYDDQKDRWLFSQFAFPDNMGSFSQCVAISHGPDPRGGYNRYEFSFDGIGFNDYPKHGIVSDSITLMANVFTKRGQRFSFGGVYLAVLDKVAMYAGQAAEMRGFNIGKDQFGFVAGDLDGPGSAAALFATAMSTASSFDIWQINPNWGSNPANISQIAGIPISAYDGTLCSASRGACIPQPDGGPELESLSDRLMHRLQIRDFVGSHRSMLAAHTVDVNGAGLAGIRWYEFRQTTGDWFKYQEGTYAPADGQYRWMPSIAMNGNGDIGMGFLLGGPSTYMSVSATGQTAAASGSGIMDAAEVNCVMGGGIQEGTGRSGDYSSTSVDPGDDLMFWHTNEYVDVGGDFIWDTWVCPFTIGSGGGGNIPPVATFSAPDCTNLDCSFDGSDSFDSDGTVVSYDWDFGDDSVGSGESSFHSYDVEGTYEVSLTVTDNEGATDTVMQSLTVIDGKPTAVITLIDCTGLSCSFDGSGSLDEGGSIVSYAWDFGDQNSGTGESTSHDYDQGGSYLVRLTVTDNDGMTNTAGQPLTVNEVSNIPPTAIIASIDCTGLVCNYLSSGSSDIDGSIVSYHWDFGDGSTGSNAADSHEYTEEGSYNVILTVTDDDGATGIANQLIDVSAPVGATHVFVTSITVDVLNRGAAKKSPRATVTVQDNEGGLAVSYEVTGDFYGDAGELGVTGVTDENGIAVLLSPNTKKARVSFEFCVTDVSGTLPYNETDNAITCLSN